MNPDIIPSSKYQYFHIRLNELLIELFGSAFLLKDGKIIFHDNLFEFWTDWNNKNNKPQKD